jgi:hypothetical protein
VREGAASPGYHCPGKLLVDGRGAYCLNIGGIQIDATVTAAFLAALEPAGLTATFAAGERLESDREAALKQWRLGVERASYEAQRAQRHLRLERRTVLFRIRFMSCSRAVGASGGRAPP